MDAGGGSENRWNIWRVVGCFMYEDVLYSTSHKCLIFRARTVPAPCLSLCIALCSVPTVMATEAECRRVWPLNGVLSSLAGENEAAEAWFVPWWNLGRAPVLSCSSMYCYRHAVPAAGICSQNTVITHITYSVLYGIALVYKYRPSDHG